MRDFTRPGDRERYGRDRRIDVVHIDLLIRPDLRSRSLAGRCRLTVAAIDRAVESVELDALEFEIGEVEDPGGPLHFEHHDGTLRIALREPLGAGAQLMLCVTYRIEGGRRGLYFASRSPAATVADECWTHGHDTDARAWFPCVDEPSQRQTVTTSIVVQAGMFALGNGDFLGVEETSETEATYRYAQHRPIPSYLVTMVVGQFARLDHAGAGVPVRSYVPPGREAEGELAFANTAEMLGVFETFTGLAYPYACYSQIAVAQFPFVGMENATATTLTDEVLHDERAHLTYTERLVAHELAHQWFGVLLIARDWSEIWLNEGFATYLEAIWIEHKHGWDEYVYAIHQQFNEYIEEASKRYIRPIVCARYRDPLELFDKHAYEKASAIVHQLRGTLGELRFRSSIRRYVQDQQDTAVESLDLARAAERQTGVNIRGFLNQWVGRAGHPELTITIRYEAVYRRMRVRIEQRQPIDDVHPPYRFTLDVAFADKLPPAIVRNAGPGNPSVVHAYSIAVDEAITEAYFPFSTRPALVRIDPNGWLPALMTVKLDIDHACAALRRDPSPIIRIRAAQQLARDASDEARRELGAALIDEPFWGVRAEIATAVGEARSAWTIKLLQQAVLDVNAFVRLAALKALAECGTIVELDGLLTQLAVEPVTAVTAQALRTLGRIRYPGAYSIIVAYLEQKSLSDIVVAGALLGLGELGDERALPTLLKYCGDEYRSIVRRSAVRGIAAAAVYFARPSLDEAVIARLTDRDMRVRQNAIDGLERIGNASATEALTRVAERDPDPRLRRYAERAAERSRRA